MRTLNLKPTHKAVIAYYAELRQLSLLNAQKEGAVSPAFANLLRHCATQFDWTLYEQYPLKHGAKNIYPDGALVDAFNLPYGYWEAKDIGDDLPAEIRKKFDAGYPKDNILFQTPHRAMLYQDGKLRLDSDLTHPDGLIDALKAFCEYQPPQYEEWQQAVAAFKAEVPKLGQGLLRLIDAERKTNKGFAAAFEAFTDVCRAAINPNIATQAVEEMLIQHLLTERIFSKVFDHPDFVNMNIVACEIEKVIRALVFPHGGRRAFFKPLDRFYYAIETTAATITEFAQKQAFLNTVYEKFFQGFSVKVADTHGIVYTPQPVVQFMVNSVEEILKAEFGTTLSDEGVHILDPFVGTGNFIIHVMQKLRRTALPHKYARELHCNEVMLLPYYIAAMNIEHEYLTLTGDYTPFDGLCLVDTFQLAEPAKQLQMAFMSEANSARVTQQRATPIFVIIGNPPYNVGQINENDNNKNRKYETMDKRVAETYAKDSAATNKNALSDVYVKAFRWAADRIGDEGVVAFVTNSGFVDGIAFDGMRKHLVQDFDAVYILDLGGNVRQNPKLSGTTHNVFGIQVGVCVTLAVKKASAPVAQTFLSGPLPVPIKNLPEGKLEIRKRNLPHWRLDGATYFVTFRTKNEELSDVERQDVLNHIVAGHQKFYTLIAVVVMPDHVHLLLLPHAEYQLSQIMKGIKGVSARKINQRRGGKGILWQDESFDRIVRDQAEFDEKLTYMLNNPVKAGLLEDGWKYLGWWYNANYEKDGQKAGEAFSPEPKSNEVAQTFLSGPDPDEATQTSLPGQLKAVSPGQPQTGMSGPPGRIYYTRLDEFWRKEQKYDWLNKHANYTHVGWQEITPDKNHTWLTEGMRAEFETFLPMGTKEAKAIKTLEPETIFKDYSNGVKTNRDTWVYNFQNGTLAQNIQRMIEVYNDHVARWSRLSPKPEIDTFVLNDDSKISWSRDLKLDVKRGNFTEFHEAKIRQSLYRPFTKKYLFFDKTLDEEIYQVPHIFPTSETESENLIICVRAIGNTKPFHCIITNSLPDLHLTGEAQCFPFYTYDEDGNNRRENITDWALAQFRARYGGGVQMRGRASVHDQDASPQPEGTPRPDISKWDVFYYVYAILHHPQYRDTYAANLKRELPRIPLVSDHTPNPSPNLGEGNDPPSPDSGEGRGGVFRAFADAGRRLADLHVNYEQQPKYPLTFIETEGAQLDWRVDKMKLSKDRAQIIYNHFLTLAGIPPEAFEYRLGNKAALHWVIDQYQVSADKRSGIVNDPNRADQPDYIVSLIQRVVTVSVETVKIVKALPPLEEFTL